MIRKHHLFILINEYKIILKRRSVYIILFLIPVLSTAQDSSLVNKNIQFNGYLKTLPAWNIPANMNQPQLTQIFHNRLNIQIKISDHFYSGISFRNRIIWGDEVKQNPKYDQFLRNRQDLLNLSVVWLKKPDLIIHSNTERLWTEYRRDKWNLRVGRQRINWSMTATWNPCDLFNVYNFLDVDYEERPGTDALKFSYLIKNMSSIEVAYAPGKNVNQTIAGIRYTFHKRKTDFQLLAGSYKRRWSIGGGWAGSLGETGWKTELQYYVSRGAEKGHLNITTELDHVLKKGWYFNLGMLYNSTGIDRRILKMDTLQFEFTPLQLMPTKFNLIISSAKEINPAFSFTSSILYSPNSDLLIVLLGLKWTISNMFDSDFIWQSFFVRTDDFKAMNHRGFIRVRWSF
jgi:hypothetical protein